MILGVAIIALLNSYHCVESLECSSDNNYVTLKNISSSTTVERRSSLGFYAKWHLISDCTEIGANLRCLRNKNNTVYQYFRVNTTTSSSQLWLFSCYDGHQPTDVAVDRYTDNGFVLKWSYHVWDEQFLKTARVNVTNKATGEMFSSAVQITDDTLEHGTYEFKNGESGEKHYVCVILTYLAPAQFTNVRNVDAVECINVNIKSSSSLKTTLLAVGIGILVLVLLCGLFVCYNKKCKPGDDHNFDMNKEEQLMAEQNVELKTADEEAEEA